MTFFSCTISFATYNNPKGSMSLAPFDRCEVGVSGDPAQIMQQVCVRIVRGRRPERHSEASIPPGHCGDLHAPCSVNCRWAFMFYKTDEIPRLEAMKQRSPSSRAFKELQEATVLVLSLRLRSRVPLASLSLGLSFPFCNLRWMNW